MATTYRYPGTKSFSFDDQAIFFGRDEDIANIVTSVVVNPTTVLFGKSGSGKSSIIQAGVIPKLLGKKSGGNEREEPYLIINVMPKPYVQGKNLWDEINKVITGGIKPVADLLPMSGAVKTASLWYLLKQFYYQQLIEGKRRAILLIFDQAEELFTYPDSQIELFVQNLFPVVGQFVPEELQNIINQQSTPLSPEKIKALYSPSPVKFIFSIRSDKLHLITRLKKASPQILQNSYELLPLAKKAAFDAVDKPAQQEGEFLSDKFIVTDDAKQYIFQKLLGLVNEPEDNFEEERIDPFSLQIICSHIERDIVPNDDDKIIEKHELGEPQKIINGYYLGCINNLKASEAEKGNTRNFIELKMIPDNRRIPIPEILITTDEKYPVSQAILSQLVEARILKKDISASGGASNWIYEITHDCFIAPILDAKLERLGKVSDGKSLETINDLLMKIAQKENRPMPKETAEKHAIIADTSSAGGKPGQGAFRQRSPQKEEPVQIISTAAYMDENIELYDLYKKLGDAYCVIKEYLLGIEWFDKVIGKADKIDSVFLIETYRARSDAYFNLGKYELWSKDLKNLLKLNPDDPYAQQYLIDNYDQHQKLEEAVEFFNNEFNVTSQNVGIYNKIANKYYEKQDYKSAKVYYEKTLQLNPDADYAYRNLGMVEELLGDAENALVNYNKALELNPNFEEAIVSAAALHFDRAEYSTAGDLYNRLIAINPNNENYYYDFGLIESQLGNIGAAIENYKKAIQIKTDYRDAIFALASIYFNQKDYELAREMSLKLIALEPDEGNYCYNMALIEAKMENFDAAIDYYNKALKLNPVYEDALLNLASIYFKRGDYEQARELYKKLISINDKSEDNYYDLGLIEERSGNLNAAIINYQKALELKPKFEEPLISLGSIYFEKEDFLKAQKIYSELATIDPENETYHYSLGLVEERMKNLDEAIVSYKKATGLKPDYESALAGLAGIYFDREDYLQAGELYRNLTSINPRNETYFYNLGLANENMRNWDLAIDNYKIVIELNQTYEPAYQGIVRSYGDMGEARKAIPELQKAIQINPKTAFLHFGLADLYDQLGEKENAVAAAREASRLGPDNADYHRLLGYLLAGLSTDRLEEAIAEFRRSIELDPNNKYGYAALGACYKRLGNETEYHRQLDIAARMDEPSEDEYFKASIEALCGNTDKAIDLLKLAFEKGLRSPDYAKRDPDFDFIRNEPGFKALVG